MDKCNPLPLDNIMGVKEAGEMWGLSADRVKGLCQSGEVIAKKVGNSWILDKNQPNPKGGRKMEKLNYTKIFGRRYKLPEGYYAFDLRFGDQVYDARGKNVTSKIMGHHNCKDMIIETDRGIEILELMD
ncbi:hypothetical protein [Bacillus toyonensis]|uniref:hypothetical protein n=1 Tax=Bacillus toyonensis TaxID=155322 RepID=UPI0015CF1723|nr:hypothetical protein [Bacillus toyonensis]